MNTNGIANVVNDRKWDCKYIVNEYKWDWKHIGDTFCSVEGTAVLYYS